MQDIEGNKKEHTWPTRVLKRVLRNLLSSCSVTLICCLMISAAVMGRRGLKGGTVCEIGLADPPTGDDGVE